MQEKTFAAACMAYFGRLPGQSIAAFQEELKALTDKDRADLISWFPSVGYKII